MLLHAFQCLHLLARLLRLQIKLHIQGIRRLRLWQVKHHGQQPGFHAQGQLLLQAMLLSQGLHLLQLGRLEVGRQAGSGHDIWRQVIRGQHFHHEYAGTMQRLIDAVIQLGHAWVVSVYGAKQVADGGMNPAAGLDFPQHALPGCHCRQRGNRQ